MENEKLTKVSEKLLRAKQQVKKLEQQKAELERKEREKREREKERWYKILNKNLDTLLLQKYGDEYQNAIDQGDLLASITEGIAQLPRKEEKLSEDQEEPESGETRNVQENKREETGMEEAGYGD